MNAQRPVPTIRSRRGLATYIAIERDARSQRHAVTPQPDPVNFCAEPEAVPPAITRRQLIGAGLIWLACTGFALWLCTAAGMAFLNAIWSAK